jgi:flagellar protein FlbD
LLEDGVYVILRHVKAWLLYYNFIVAVYLGERVAIVIELTKLKGERFALNSDQIETMEATPDTVITLLNGHKYVVRERVTEIISLIESFRKRVSAPPSL